MFEIVRRQVKACNVISKYWRYKFGRKTISKLIQRLRKNGILKSVLKEEFCIHAKKKVFLESNIHLVHEVMVRIVFFALHVVDKHLLCSFELKVGFFASAYLYSVFSNELLFCNSENDERTNLMVEKATEFTDSFETVCDIILEISEAKSSYCCKKLSEKLQNFLALVTCFHYFFDQWKLDENQRILEHAKEHTKIFYQWFLLCPTPFLQYMFRKYSEKVVQIESKKVLQEWLSSIDRFEILQPVEDVVSARYYPISMFYYNVLHACNLNRDFQLKENGSSLLEREYFWMYSVADMFSVSELVSSLSAPKYSYLIQMLAKIQELFNLFFFEGGIVYGTSGVQVMIEKMQRGLFKWTDLHGLLKRFALEVYHIMQIYSQCSVQRFSWKKIMVLEEGNMQGFGELFFELFDCLQQLAIQHVNSEVKHFKNQLEASNIQKEKILFDKNFPKSISRSLVITNLILDHYDFYLGFFKLDGRLSKDIGMLLMNNLNCVYFFHCAMLFELWTLPKLEAKTYPETLCVDWKQLEIMKKGLYVIILKAKVIEKLEDFLKCTMNTSTETLFSEEDISKIMYLLRFVMGMFKYEMLKPSHMLYFLTTFCNVSWLDANGFVEDLHLDPDCVDLRQKSFSFYVITLGTLFYMDDSSCVQHLEKISKRVHLKPFFEEMYNVVVKLKILSLHHWKIHQNLFHQIVKEYMKVERKYFKHSSVERRSLQGINQQQQLGLIKDAIAHVVKRK